ncbi:MAG: 30S ribosomal protein S6, partial [Acidobacteriota bacterium]
MRRYEVVFVLAPTLSDQDVKEKIESFTQAAEEKGAKILDVNQWGRRRLAFPVKKHSEGVYTILTLEEESAKAVAELERRFKVSDAVIRFLSIRVDHSLGRAEKFKLRRQEK